MSRHMARDRVAAFVRSFRAGTRPSGLTFVGSAAVVDRMIADLDALSRPRRVIRTLPQLQALPVGTVIRVQGERAAQVESNYDFNFNEDGVVTEGTRLLYAGTDLTDDLVAPDQLTRDTLRRMLPAIVIDTKED